MRGNPLFVSCALILVLACASADPAAAQFGKLKDKVKDKVERKVDKTLQGGGEQEQAPAPEAPVAAEPDAEGAPGAAPAPAAGGTATAEDMTLYTKYDFVPGDKVLFYDDLSREEMAEFPSRWSLDRGVFEIAKAEGRAWILCSDKGSIRPKITPAPLPDKYTVEMDFYSAANHDGWYTIHWLDAAGDRIGHLRIGYSYMTSLDILDKNLAGKDLEVLPRGLHTMRIMATKSSIKCFIDQQRVANVPKVEGFAPVGFAVEMDPYFEDTGITRVGTFRFAEGGKSLREQLDESGRIITHGILFDSGSDRIKAESFKTLSDIGTMLTDDAALRLSIEGHTDADGAEDANLDLSQRRAGAVRTWLAEKFSIAGDRLETKGLGEGQPIDGNDTAEGKANNRRVELVKL